jgi:YD repeat-containing protein
MTGVWEDPLGLNYETDYAYDGFGNLTGVTQKGGSTSSSTWRTRTFTYDGMSRLTQSVNPESGTINYFYTTPKGVLCSGTADALCYKTAPSPNQPASGTAMVTTTYTYDALNRVTTKSYVDSYKNPVTATVSYAYDGVAPSACTPPAVVSPFDSGIPVTPTNTIGRRSAMCDASGATAWIFDSMGRPTIEERTLNGVTHNVGYTYYLDGNEKHIRYPSDDEIEIDISGAGRVLGVEDLTDNDVYNSVGYTAGGALASMTQFTTSGSYVVGFSTDYLYNKRLQRAGEFAGYNGIFLYKRC